MQNGKLEYKIDTYWLIGKNRTDSKLQTNSGT